MSLLSQAKSGVSTDALRILLYGTEGIGKTTWAAQIPGVIFLSAEDGSGDLDTTQIRIESWDMLLEAVADLITEPHDYRVVALDSLGSIEKLLWEHICEKNKAPSIEEVAGGYGKGYTFAQEALAFLVKRLDVLRIQRKMHIVWLGHAHVKPFNDPTGAAFDRYELRANAKASAVVVSWCDAVLFACLDVTVKSGRRILGAGDDKKGKATESKRVVYTTKDAAYDAKNRHSLPEELPLEWSAFAKAIGWARREAVLLPPPVTEADIVAAIQSRTDATEEEAGILAGRVATAFSGDLRRAMHAATAGISDPKLAEKVAELRGGAK